MTKKTRLIMLAVCAVLFLIITPYIVLYSLGYRVDFKNLKIVTTGGIYVKVMPQGADVIIDNKLHGAKGLFNSTVFVQNLLPNEHSILIKKDDYFEYKKNLQVVENEVTKLEHVFLIKKEIPFQLLKDATLSPFIKPVTQEAYVIKNNALYYSNIKANSTLTQIQKTTPLLKKVVAYQVINNNFVWLGQDGFLYRSDLLGKNTEALSQTALTISKNTYKFTTFNQYLFLQDGNNVMLFNEDKKAFENFYSPVKELVISQNHQRMLYQNDHEVLYSDLTTGKITPIFLNRFSGLIKKAFWLNDDYIIFQLDNSIMISEIDVRGNINQVTLPTVITLVDGTKVEIQNPEISYNPEEKKLYILQEKTVFVSEKLVP